MGHVRRGPDLLELDPSHPRRRCERGGSRVEVGAEARRHARGREHARRRRLLRGQRRDLGLRDGGRGAGRGGSGFCLLLLLLTSTSIPSFSRLHRREVAAGARSPHRRQPYL